MTDKTDKGATLHVDPQDGCNGQLQQIAAERDALAARLAELEAREMAVEVEKLSWSEMGAPDSLIASPTPYQIHPDNEGSGAPDDPFMKYENYRVFEPHLMLSVGPNGDGTDQFDTLDAAKAAAQADYERRILAALKSARPVRVVRNEALEQAADHITKTQISADDRDDAWERGNNSGVKGSAAAIRALMEGDND